ncbi:MAG TPA: sulfurtransferase-like selenium metabolism protein YedF [Spirochaetota bacterium]|nr:sulfurtransferase-like selenium metabolism protein YedF [Spirochaetota bacterium]HPQ51911.1 sulfurtransferase-like selenium metabolism protein YedF [Spirochaetota bacterium]
MGTTIDAKGLACPQPVVLTKKALEKNDSVIVIVDNETAKENVSRLAEKSGCSITVEPASDGTFRLTLSKTGTASPSDTAAEESGNAPTPVGPNVFVIAANTMGKGDDELGEVLMKAFIHTIFDLDYLPDTVIFYNTGVKLAVKDSDVLDDLKKLEAQDVEILVCGTCANFFNIKDDIAVGIISNMYDIAGTMSRAGRIVMP